MPPWCTHPQPSLILTNNFSALTLGGLNSNFMLSTSFWLRREALNFTSSSWCIHRFYPIPPLLLYMDGRSFSYPMLLLLLLCENDEADYCVKGPTPPRLSLLFWLRLFSCTAAACNVVTSIDRDVIATCEDPCEHMVCGRKCRCGT